jgi:hypothetical protein
MAPRPEVEKLDQSADQRKRHQLLTRQVGIAQQELPNKLPSVLIPFCIHGILFPDVKRGS